MTKPKVEVGDEVTVRGIPGVRVVEAIADGIARPSVVTLKPANGGQGKTGQ
jgi:hypothetical protein